MARSLRLLHEALKSRLAGMNDQLLSMNTVKETLESDIQTLQMAHDMVSKVCLVAGWAELTNVSCGTSLLTLLIPFPRDTTRRTF